MISQFCRNNNSNQEQYNLNDKKHFPFLKSFSPFQFEILHKYKIIDDEIYANLVQKSSGSINNDDQIV